MRTFMFLAVIGLVAFGVYQSSPRGPIGPQSAAAKPEKVFVYEAVDGSIVECDMTPPAPQVATKGPGQ